MMLTSTVIPYQKSDSIVSNYQRLEIDAIESRCKRHVAGLVYRLLVKPEALQSATPSRTQFDWEAFYLSNSIEQIAYHRWWALINQHRKGYEIRLRENYPELFTRAGLSELPAIPTVKRLVAAEHRHIKDSQDNVFNRYKSRRPPQWLDL